MADYLGQSPISGIMHHIRTINNGGYFRLSLCDSSEYMQWRSDMQSN